MFQCQCNTLCHYQCKSFPKNPYQIPPSENNHITNLSKTLTRDSFSRARLTSEHYFDHAFPLKLRFLLLLLELAAYPCINLFLANHEV